MIYLYSFLKTSYAAPRPNAASPTAHAAVEAAYHYTSGNKTVPSAGSFLSANATALGPWEPAAIKHSDVSLSGEVTSGDLRVTVSRDNVVALLFQTNNPSSVWLQIRVKAAIGSEHSFIWLGRVKTVEFKETEAVMLCQSVHDMLRRPGLSPKYSRQCSWALYDNESHTFGNPRCRLNKNETFGYQNYLWRKDGLIESISADGRTITSAALASKADGHFNAGLFEIRGTSTAAQAANAFIHSRMIVRHEGNTVELMTPIDGLTVGTLFNAFKGCDRSKESCKSFNNVANFGGFDIPEKNPFVTGVMR